MKESAAEVTEKMQRQFIRTFCRPEVASRRLDSTSRARPRRPSRRS
jgi:hypothetical protein